MGLFSRPDLFKRKPKQLGFTRAEKPVFDNPTDDPKPTPGPSVQELTAELKRKKPPS